PRTRGSPSWMACPFFPTACASLPYVAGSGALSMNRPGSVASSETPMKLLLVCGPWCSGTTAVAGLLYHLGAVGFGPYVKINVSKWPNSFELMPFRDTLRAFISPGTLSLPANSEKDAESRLRILRARMEHQEFGSYDAG